ncbi:hypothetical protein GIB67_005515 [Kingdonia uniflora]|uniref:non-specific serine/threonine protein kinase n=1 Tax=Kingdonia uniflora TaxID=39325 RepID=A0A7J7NHV1_9MAGN|nr:hypothetical protein GIB67_005515 [Kingdonia uniflora]
MAINEKLIILMKKPILGLKLYVVISICVISFIALTVSILLCSLCNRGSKKRKSIQMISKDVSITKIATSNEELKQVTNEKLKGDTDTTDTLIRIGFRSPESYVSGYSSSVLSDVTDIGWGKWYTLRELKIATCNFSKDNVIGEGGFGTVYRGVLPDDSVVAVKYLFNNQGQAEKEFRVEVEAIGKVRHINLVGLVGYCVEGVERLLLYEFMDNGNLEQWLHEDVGSVSPLTWDIRMKIAIGTAKGLAYLHEGLEPKVVHRDVKSSNILLDTRWNPKVSDFGLAKLLGSDASYVTTRVMGTFGYVAPEYAHSGKLTEGSDVYSFGILLMEIISGRSPVDYSKQTEEGNLVYWFKRMVSSKRAEEIVDPQIEVHPTSRALKRSLLVCLRCIDLDVTKRPKMGQVVHMLEADEFPYHTKRGPAREQVATPHREMIAGSDGTPFLLRTPDGRSCEF